MNYRPPYPIPDPPPGWDWHLSIRPVYYPRPRRFTRFGVLRWLVRFRRWWDWL